MIVFTCPFFCNTFTLIGIPVKEYLHLHAPNISIDPPELKKF